MNIYLNIEKIITYAKIHLLLDEADEIYVRNALMQKFGLTDYQQYEVDEDEIEAMANPFAILDNLFAYALDKHVCNEGDRKLFDAEVMDIVSLRPGAMEDTFESLMRNPAKALDWAYDYAIKNGSARCDFDSWENKGDKNLEVVFADCCGGKKSYPGCCMCLEGEGYGVHRNERYIRLPIKGDWYFKAAKRSYMNSMGHVIKASHEPLSLDKAALDVMFDFVEFAPTWFICTSENDGAHSHFVCGNKQLPIHKAGEKNKFKNKNYPYIGIVETDWYISTLRLSCTNREKLTEFTLKLLDAYKKDGGKAFVSLRKVESKFIVELSFMREVFQKENGLASLDTCAMAGIFRISSNVNAQLKEIEKYLTKEVRFTPLCLTGGMEAHAKMINKLLKEVGTNKLGAVEAALDVKEECKKTLVEYLSDASAEFEAGMSALIENI